MPSPERYYGVWLNEQRAGVLHVRDDYTWFVLDRAYIDDPERAVLGLQFEEDLHARHSANMRLPPWFSNLLPEGRFREWIAAERGVPVDREMQLLAQIGHDLPGAVRVSAADEGLPESQHRERQARPADPEVSRWRFSLAGVQMKFSMLRRGDRFTAPARGEDGDWIVKLPDATFAHVPRNEHAMMELGRRAGLEVPETRLVHRDDVEDLPDAAWPRGEEWAFAVRRFDRGPGGARVHMEDFAQVRGFYPGSFEKYRGSYETVAALAYRRRDLASLLELTRRLAFHIVIRNGDAHLKNWSLLYRDPRVPVLSPVYDLVATSVYREDREDLALRFGGTKRFEDVSRATFAHLGERLHVDGVQLVGEMTTTVERTLEAWPEVRGALLQDTFLGEAIDAVIRASAARLLRG